MSREHATPGLIAATRLVLREIAEILETYPRAVIAGGSVPYLLIPQGVEPHEGTVDIDVVLDLKQPGADAVYTLHEILERRLFVQDPKKPFRYTKGVDIEGEPYQVPIELLAGGDPAPNGLGHIQSEDVYVSIVQGMEVALENPLEVQLPDDSNRSVSVASLPAFFSMKAFALSRREDLNKSKDAYDIVYCLRNYPGGVDAVAKEFRSAISSPNVASGIELLKRLLSQPMPLARSLTPGRPTTSKTLPSNNARPSNGSPSYCRSSIEGQRRPEFTAQSKGRSHRFPWSRKWEE